MRRAFARQCVLSLQEGARATLTLQHPLHATGAALSRGQKPTYCLGVQLVLSTDGLRLLWTPVPGAPNIEGSGTTANGFVRTTDVRSVVYAGTDSTTKPAADEEARPTYSRFALHTPFETINFASTQSSATPLEKRAAGVHTNMPSSLLTPVT